MGKRQIRVNRNDILTQASQLLAQATVQLVQRNRVVVPGKLISITQNLVELSDSRNGKHVFPLHHIEEIIFDVEAEY